MNYAELKLTSAKLTRKMNDINYNIMNGRASAQNSSKLLS